MTRWPQPWPHDTGVGAFTHAPVHARPRLRATVHRPTVTPRRTTTSAPASRSPRASASSRCHGRMTKGPPRRMSNWSAIEQRERRQRGRMQRTMQRPKMGHFLNARRRGAPNLREMTTPLDAKGSNPKAARPPRLEPTQGRVLKGTTERTRNTTIGVQTSQSQHWEVDPVSWTPEHLCSRSPRAKTRPPYPPEFRRQMVLVRAGRLPEELAQEFEHPGARAAPGRHPAR